jgi:hypothetical protein
METNNNKYKVMRVQRKTGNKKLIEKDLTEAEAQRLCQSFPNKPNSMVSYFKE